MDMQTSRSASRADGLASRILARVCAPVIAAIDRGLVEGGIDATLPARRFEVANRVEPELVYAEQVAAEHAERVGDEDEQRQRDQRGRDARRDEVAVRIGAERRQRVDLFGHAHGAELRRHRRRHAARDHEAEQNGAELAHDADDDYGRHGGLRAEP